MTRDQVYGKATVVIVGQRARFAELEAAAAKATATIAGS